MKFVTLGNNPSQAPAGLADDVRSVERASAADVDAFAMSVDVEDYFQVWAFSDVISRDSWDNFPLRVGETTRACLDLFDRHNVKATFFTLGWIAEREPGLVRDIVERGHEIASHGYDHTKVSQQTRRAFSEDVIRTKDILENITGVAVRGYRAAGFSIDHTTPWAHDALSEAGYEYSSSTHPIAHDHYGDPTAPQIPYKPVAESAFLEAPVATLDVMGKRISCAGGGWFRAMPTPLSKLLIRQASASLDGPVIFYFHPWEIDANQPRIADASMRSKFRHYLNLAQMPGKLNDMLGSFSWRRVDDVLGMRPCGEAP